MSMTIREWLEGLPRGRCIEEWYQMRKGGERSALWTYRRASKGAKMFEVAIAGRYIRGQQGFCLTLDEAVEAVEKFLKGRKK